MIDAIAITGTLLTGVCGIAALPWSRRDLDAVVQSARDVRDLLRGAWALVRGDA